MTPCKAIFLQLKKKLLGNSLAVQWLGLSALTAVGQGSIPSQGTKILQAMRPGQKHNNKQMEHNQLLT